MSIKRYPWSQEEIEAVKAANTVMEAMREQAKLFPLRSSASVQSLFYKLRRGYEVKKPVSLEDLRDRYGSWATLGSIDSAHDSEQLRRAIDAINEENGRASHLEAEDTDKAASDRSSEHVSVHIEIGASSIHVNLSRESARELWKTVMESIYIIQE